MSDNTTLQSATPATAPAGLVIAGDDVGGAFHQRVKPVWGADGAVNDVSAAAPLPVVQTGTPALPTDAATQTTLAAVLAALIAGTPVSGNVEIVNDSGNPISSSMVQTRISVTPTVSNSPAYTAKDAVGGLLTFANAARVSGGTLIIQSAVVIDAAQQMPALDLVLFDRTFTASSDNAIFAPSDADLANIVGVIPLSAWSDFSTNSVAVRFGLGLAVKLNGTSLFGQLVTRGTPTFVATTDVTVILEIIQD